MKFILTGVFLFFGSLAWAAPAITFTSTYLMKSTSGANYDLIGYLTANIWCAGVGGRQINIEGIAAAHTLEALADGLYSCQGDFVAVPGINELKVFSLSSCQSTTSSTIQSSCTP